MNTLKKTVLSLWLLAPIGLVGMVAIGVAGFYDSSVYYFFGGVMLCGFAIAIVSAIGYALYSIWFED